jgi:hypothetical protein
MGLFVLSGKPSSALGAFEALCVSPTVVFFKVSTFLMKHDRVTNEFSCADRDFPIYDCQNGGTSARYRKKKTYTSCEGSTANIASERSGGRHGDTLKPHHRLPLIQVT